jgi:hypothetical protein
MSLQNSCRGVYKTVTEEFTEEFIEQLQKSWKDNYRRVYVTVTKCCYFHDEANW